MKSVPEDMDVPQMRRDISKVQNVVWLIRNLGINNRTHPKFNETMSMLQNICRANQDDSFIKGMRMTLTASELI